MLAAKDTKNTLNFSTIAKMEEEKDKHKVHDIELLLELIQCATSQSPDPDDSILPSLEKEERQSLPVAFTEFYPGTHGSNPNSSSSLPFERLESFVHSSQGSPVGKILTYGRLVGGKSDLEVGHRTPIGAVDVEVSDMRDTHSMISTFRQLSFKDGLSDEARNFQRVNALEERNVLSLTSCGSNKFSNDVNHRENMNFSKLDYQTMDHEAYFWQPLARQMDPTKFLSSVPASGIEVQTAPHRAHPQHYLPGVEHCPSRMHLQELSPSGAPWFHIEEENLIRENGNGRNGLRTWNIKQSCIDLPLSCEDEHLSQESFQNYKNIWGLTCSGSTLAGSSPCNCCGQSFYGRGVGCPFSHGNIFYPTHPQVALSAKGFDAIQEFSKVGKQKFPEKILTKKNGLPSVKTINFNFVENNEPPKHSIADGTVPANGYFHLNPHILSPGSFQWDGGNFRGQSYETKGGRHDNMSFQPQKSDSIDEVTGKIYYMAKDQYGCRFLQRKLTEGTAHDIEKIFVEIVGHIPELVTQPFGNYVVQKLLQVCDKDQMTQIIYMITIKAGELVRISCNKHGTRVVQKVIEATKNSKQISMIVYSLKLGVVNLIKDANGYHVARCCLEYLIPEYTEFIFEAATVHCVEIAMNRYGCCVLKDSLCHFDGEQRCQLISEIASNALILSQDPFGNYVVQHVLELEIPWATADVLKRLEGNCGYLSKQKFSSNVIEKCLQCAGEEHLPHIIGEFIDSKQLDRIMQDRFGNFVVQTALKYSKGTTLHAALMEAIRPHIPALRTSPYGKKLLSGDCFEKQASLSSPSSSVKTKLSQISLRIQK